MSKPSRQSFEKKRKKQKAERARRLLVPSDPIAYHGRQFRSKAHLPWLLQAEVAIYEAYVMTDRQLTDLDVATALQDMIEKIRNRVLGELRATAQPEQELKGTPRDFIVWNIWGRWQEIALNASPPGGREGLIGMLRTILGSVENHNTGSASSQGYLLFIAAFMRSAGINVRKVPRNDVVSLSADDEEEPPVFGLE